MENRQQYHVLSPNDHFVSPHQLYRQPPASFPGTAFPQPQVQVPFTTAGYQDPLSGTFITSGPIVHEGYIPAPGGEDEIDEASYRHSLFQNQNFQSDDEEDSEYERALAADEERILREIENKNELQEAEDSDFLIEDLGENEDDPDELLVEGDLIDEEEVRIPDVEEEEPELSPTKRKRGRPRGRGRGRGRVPRGAETKREGKQGKLGGPKGKRGPRAIADPGPQFKDLQRMANEFYMRRDFPGAIEYANKAIQLNPEIFASHSLLSEIYAEMGEEQKSVEALIVGAPTKRDKELWFHIIDRVNGMNSRKYPLFTDENKQAIVLDCLKSIILLDTNDYDARSQRLEIESDLGHVSRCVKLCRKMLTIRPYDDDVLKQMARLGTSSSKQTKIHLDRIIHSFDTSVAYFLANDDPSSSNLDWSLLNIYLDLLDRLGDYPYALFRLKSLSRWIQGRSNETYWDIQKDDREFDLADDPRRTAVPEFTRISRKTKYGKTLPFEIRVKMGIFRLRQVSPNFSEAMYHFETLEPDDDGPDARVLDYPDLFCDIADALHATGHDNDALRFYEPLYNNESRELGLRGFIGLYTCHKNLDHKEKTDNLISIFQKWKTESLDDLAVLAKFFEDIGMVDEALQRGELVFRNGGGRLLQKMGLRAYTEIQSNFWVEKQKARGKHGVRKSRVRTHMKDLSNANMDEEGTADEPLLVERPKKGFFRTKKSPPGRRPKAFLPVEIETLSGTNVPVNVIDQRLFRKKLTALANEFPDELKAARAQHREIVASFKRLDEISDAAEHGDEAAILEFISIARELIEEFSTFDLFYYDRREDFKGYFRRLGSGDIWKESALMMLAVVANNVEDGEEEPEIVEKPAVVPQDFYGIRFDKWLEAFIQYAICLAHRGEEDRCFSTIEVANQSNIFYRSQAYSHQFQICRLACALSLDDSMEASSAVRWLMRTYPFGSDLFRLYGCVNRLCSIPDGFATGPSLKVLLRYIKTMDYALLTPEQRTWYNFRGNDHTAWMAKAVSSQLSTYVKDHDPTIFTLYAYILTCGGSYQTALTYYFRAYTITPNDPVLNLSIGLAYIQHAMKRLSENRQFQIQQGLSFIYRYYDLRTRDGVAVRCSEAEFNMGRVWHSLGLVTQALPAYQRCIALSGQVREEAEKKDRDRDENGDVDMDMDGGRVEDFATEAAFAMQSIYALSGNFDAARKVTEEVLVIE